jgi:hypothetical protein
LCGQLAVRPFHRDVEDMESARPPLARTRSPHGWIVKSRTPSYMSASAALHENFPSSWTRSATSWYVEDSRTTSCSAIHPTRGSPALVSGAADMRFWPLSPLNFLSLLFPMDEICSRLRFQFFLSRVLETKQSLLCAALSSSNTFLDTGGV